MADADEFDELAKRFWPKVEKTEHCWTWSGAKNRRGYGWLHNGSRTTRKPMRAHRASWEIHFGKIPDGLWVLHRCDNPPCVRPDHLFLGTRTDNMRDCAAKGRVSTIGKSRMERCKRGHEFSEANTLIIKRTGHRRCRLCASADKRERRIRARGAR